MAILSAEFFSPLFTYLGFVLHQGNSIDICVFSPNGSTTGFPENPEADFDNWHFDCNKARQKVFFPLFSLTP